MKRKVEKMILSLALTVAFCACNSHKEVVVNAYAEFDATEVWTLVEIRGKEVPRNDVGCVVTLTINPEAGTFRGNSGCNTYFGNFKDMGEGKMILSEINATKMACPDDVMKKESNYLQNLRRCDNFVLDQYSLELRQGEKPLLKFEKAEP